MVHVDPGVSGANQGTAGPMAEQAKAAPDARRSEPAIRTAPAERETGRPDRQGIGHQAIGNQGFQDGSGEVRSGMLTAGSLDDNDRYEDYRQYLASAGLDSGFASFPLGQRVMIRVTNRQGQGLGDVRVLIRPAPFQASDRNARQALPVELQTGSDGRTLFLTAQDGRQWPTADLQTNSMFAVTVQPPDGSPPVTQTFSLGQASWTVRLNSIERALPKRLDLALAIDTTGSMEDELSYLKAEFESIANSLAAQFPQVKIRFALITYRDQGEEYITSYRDFTESLADFQRELARERAVGGGDYPEAVHSALAKAAELNWSAHDAARVLFVVGDAPPHDADSQAAFNEIARLHKTGVRIFPLAASGVSPRFEYLFRAAAMSTLGQYLFLTDHSGVGAAHAAPSAPEFKVERLNDLMLRLAASEVAGERIPPRQLLATVGVQASPSYASASSIHVASRASWWDGSTPRWIVLLGALVGVLVIDAWGRRRQAGESSV